MTERKQYLPVSIEVFLGTQEFKPFQGPDIKDSTVTN